MTYYDKQIQKSIDKLNQIDLELLLQKDKSIWDIKDEIEALYGEDIFEYMNTLELIDYIESEYTTKFYEVEDWKVR